MRCLPNCSADWLALAHHRDDQVETVLFRLLRGAGVSGAAGMPAERHQRGGPRLIRPLLEVPSAVIALYAQEHSLAWVEDESNSRFALPPQLLAARGDAAHRGSSFPVLPGAGACRAPLCRGRAAARRTGAGRSGGRSGHQGALILPISIR
jgi:hypothetical protein